MAQDKLGKYKRASVCSHIFLEVVPDFKKSCWSDFCLLAFYYFLPNINDIGFRSNCVLTQKTDRLNIKGKYSQYEGVRLWYRKSWLTLQIWKSYLEYWQAFSWWAEGSWLKPGCVTTGCLWASPVCDCSWGKVNEISDFNEWGISRRDRNVIAQD